MKYNRDIHQRRSIRLKEYDYSQAGAYFVTICIKGRECLMGKIRNHDIMLNDVGEMAEKWWGKIPDKFPMVKPDVYIIMPNHLHGIISIVGADPRVCPGSHGYPESYVRPGSLVCAEPRKGAHIGAPLHRVI